MKRRVVELELELENRNRDSSETIILAKKRSRPDDDSEVDSEDMDTVLQKKEISQLGRKFMFNYAFWAGRQNKVDSILTLSLDLSYNSAKQWKDLESIEQGYLQEILELLPEEMHELQKKPWFRDQVRQLLSFHIQH
jgi:hypothetical protein